MKRAVVPLVALVLFGACGFPEVSYRNGGDDGGSDGPGPMDAPIGAEASGGDGAGGDGAPVDATSGGEGASEAGDATSFVDGEGTPGTDATTEAGDSSASVDTGIDAPVTPGDARADAPSDASVADETPAESGSDAPADVHEAAVDAPPVCEDQDQDTYISTATCGGNDCCDTDALAHPGQTTFFTKVDGCGSFDYDCNGTQDPQYPVNLSCGGTGLTGCTGGSGFLLNPGCGNSGVFATCVPNGILACQPGSETTVTQGCR